MHNELLTIGNITIYGYGLMIAIGILCCFFVLFFYARFDIIKVIFKSFGGHL